MNNVARKTIMGNIFGMTVVIDPDLQKNEVEFKYPSGRVGRLDLKQLTVKTTICRADCPCPVCNNILWEFQEGEVGSQCSKCGWPKHQKQNSFR